MGSNKQLRSGLYIYLFSFFFWYTIILVTNICIFMSSTLLHHSAIPHNSHLFFILIYLNNLFNFYFWYNLITFIYCLFFNHYAKNKLRQNKQWLWWHKSICTPTSRFITSSFHIVSHYLSVQFKSITKALLQQSSWFCSLH